MAPREGSSITPQGRVERTPTALLIGNKCAILVAEDLGYSGDALNMKCSTIMHRVNLQTF
ncbi:Alternative oxidasemitochondrial precursor [Penicillium lividum]|nr:Alternative oxidasemitochondrial precursor [Penicillium lividum]